MSLQFINQLIFGIERFINTILAAISNLLMVFGIDTDISLFNL